MAERGVVVDHTTVWRWCQKYGPAIYHRLRGKLKYTTTTWHMDETYVRVAGRWVYLFRAVDSHGMHRSANRSSTSRKLKQKR